MKNPGYPTAKNEYAGRSNTKLNLNQKQQLKVDMRAFTDRLKGLVAAKENKAQ